MSRNKNYQRLPDGRLLSQPRHPATGRRVRVTASTRSELEQRLRRLEDVRQGLRWGELSPRDVDRIIRPASGHRRTVGELWALYAPGVPPRSRAVADSTWRHRLAPHFAELLPWELDETRMRTWAAKLAGPPSNSASKTIRSAYDWLAGCMRIAIDDGTLDGYPWRGWRPPRAVAKKRERCHSIEELARLLEAGRALDERDWKQGRWSDRVVRLTVLGLCGLRQGEGVGLAWDHVDLDLGILYVEFQGARGWPRRWPEGRPFDPPKTKPRTLKLHQGALDALKLQRAALLERGWYRDDGPVFPAPGGTFRHTSRCFKPEALREIVQAAELPNPAAWTTHSMRHTFAQLETNTSGDLRGTMARTGHSSLAQLQGYLEAAGRGLTPSAVPALPEGVLPQVVGPARSPVALLVEKTEASREEALHAREERDAERAADARKPFDELAAEWLAAGRKPEPRPAAVTRAVRLAYVRGYNRELAADCKGERWETLSEQARELISSRDPEHALELVHDMERRKLKARAAGRRAKTAALGAWGQAVKRAERWRRGSGGGSAAPAEQCAG